MLPSIASSKNSLSGFLESLKLEYLDMLRSLFLRHLQNEMAVYCDADVYQEIPLRDILLTILL